MKYCSECGAQLSSGAKFCHKCGKDLSGSPTAAQQQGQWPWIAGGFAVIVVAVAAGVAMFQSGPQSPPAAGGPPAQGPVDPLTLPPREQADRLFDRVMSLTEQGDSTQAAFFIPMAIQAHEMLDLVDVDARFHIAELELLRGGLAAARAQADTLAASAQNHLFAAIIRGKAAEQEGDDGAAAEAYRAFLTNQQAERAANRPEYQQHQFALNQFAERAQAAVGPQ